MTGAMVHAVIPACNEEGSILGAAANALAAGARLVHVVANGCGDRTVARAASLWPAVVVHAFPEPLGLDVPRALGLAACLGLPMDAVLFLDADMCGPIHASLRQVLAPVLAGSLDLSLASCGVQDPDGGSVAAMVGRALEALNRRLGLYLALGQASPSHGPFACSARFAVSVELREFAVPPLLLARAALGGLSAGIGTRMPHRLLGSPYRGREHASLVAATIIGDCAEAMAIADGRPRSRVMWEREFAGLNPVRRFDVLNDVRAAAAGMPLKDGRSE